MARALWQPLFLLCVASLGYTAEAANLQDFLQDLQDLPAVLWFKRTVLRIGSHEETVTKEEKYLWDFFGLEDGSLCSTFGFEEQPYFFILLQIVTSVGTLAFTLLVQRVLEQCGNCVPRRALKVEQQVSAKFYEGSEYLGFATVEKVNGDGTYQVRYEPCSGYGVLHFHAVPAKFLLPFSQEGGVLPGLQSIRPDVMPSTVGGPGVVTGMVGGGRVTGGAFVGSPYLSMERNPQNGVGVCEVGSFISHASKTDLDQVMQSERSRLEIQNGPGYTACNPSDEFEVGQFVRALVLKPSLRYYPATVMARNPNGTYKLEFGPRKPGKIVDHVLLEHIDEDGQSRLGQDDTYLQQLDGLLNDMGKGEETDGTDPEKALWQHQGFSSCFASLWSDASATHALRSFKSWDGSRDRLCTFVDRAVAEEYTKREREIRMRADLAKEKRATILAMLYWTWQIAMSATSLFRLARRAWSHGREKSLSPWPMYNLFVFGYIHSGAFATLMHGALWLVLTRMEEEARLNNPALELRREFEDVNTMHRRKIQLVSVMRAVLAFLISPLLPVVFTHVIPAMFIYIWPLLLCSCCVVPLSGLMVTFVWPWHVSNNFSIRTRQVLTVVPFAGLVFSFQTLPAIATRVWAGETELSLMHVLDPLMNDYLSRTWQSVVACKAGSFGTLTDEILRWS